LGVKYSLTVVAALCVLAGGVAATRPVATRPATRAATQAANPAHASPEKTWASICDALKEGDLERFRSGFYNGSEVARLFMETYSDVTVATFDLARATAALGEKGRHMGEKFESVYTELVQGGENRKAEVTGDRIKWVHAKKPEKGAPDDVIFFKKVKGEWLIDTVATYELDTDAGRQAAEKMIETVPPMTALLKSVAEEIRAGKIRTVEQMQQRLGK
jgi:hypothetical protein